MPPHPLIAGEGTDENGEFFAEQLHVVEIQRHCELREGKCVALHSHLRGDGYFLLGDAAGHDEAVPVWLKASYQC